MLACDEHSSLLHVTDCKPKKVLKSLAAVDLKVAQVLFPHHHLKVEKS
jgi:hypothetical protein